MPKRSYYTDDLLKLFPGGTTIHLNILSEQHDMPSGLITGSPDMLAAYVGGFCMEIEEIRALENDEVRVTCRLPKAVEHPDDPYMHAEEVD